MRETNKLSFSPEKVKNSETLDQIFYQFIYKPSYCKFPESRENVKFNF